MATSNQNRATAAIKSAMDRMELTQEELAGILGRAQPTISEILNGRRSISPEIAIDIETALNGQVTAEGLLEMQASHQLEEARKGSKGEEIRLKAKLRSEFPISEMERRGWIPKFEEIERKVEAVLNFANGSADLDQIRPAFEYQALARQSSTLMHLAPSSCASRAWQYRVRELAEMTPVKEFDHDIFVEQGLVELRSLVRNSKNIAQVPLVLAKYGIRFVVVERLMGTKLDGIATWLDSDRKQCPIVALTLRLGHIDSFWFNLAHELHHIKLKHAFSLNTDSTKGGDIDEQDLKEIEEEANREAANWLIPRARLSSFIERNSGKISEANVLAFSQMVDVHPGVLVGLLQFQGIVPYSRFSNLKVEVRKFALMAAMADGFGLPLAKKNKSLI